MQKYRGTYRVMFECDTRTGQAAEFTYIPCRIRPGANIYRYNDDTLAVYISGTKVVNNLLENHWEIFRPFQKGDKEAALLFAEKDVEKAAFILKPRIQGKNMNPKPRKKRTMSEKQKEVLREQIAKARSYKSLSEKNTVSDTVNQFSG